MKRAFKHYFEVLPQQLRYACKAGISALIFILAFSFSATAQIITTIAGMSAAGFSGDGGPASAAVLNFPLGLSVDSDGDLYIADSDNERIRKINPIGIITTVAGNGVGSFSGDGGPATNAHFNGAIDVAVDRTGNLYILDQGNYRIRKVDTAGIITTIAGNGSVGYSGDGGPATAASIPYIAGIAVDTAGNVYMPGNKIRRVDASSGTITAIAGDGTGVYSGDGGPATAAGIGGGAMDIDRAGNMYIRAYNRIRKIDTFGIIYTIAGDSAIGYSGDGGPGTAAELSNQLQYVSVDSAGNVYICDAWASRVRKVNASGIINTIGGDGSQAFGGDGGPATAAAFSSVVAAVRHGSSIYISDRNNCRIRKIALPEILINASPGDTICAGTPVIFTASVTNDASMPLYQWQLNSVNTGTDTPAYVADTLHNGDVVSCILSYTFGDTVTATSNIITMAVDSFLHAGPLTGADTVCTGDTTALAYGAAGGAWRSDNAHAAVSGGMVAGITAGIDTIHYTVTNACGIDSAVHIITVAACPSGVAPPGLSAAAEEVLRVLPNPNDGTFTFSLSAATNESVRIVITNLVGEKVKEVTTTTNKTTAITLDAPAGMYFISAATVHGKWSKKIIITK